jgi:cytoskeletal protein RodZ
MSAPMSSKIASDAEHTKPPVVRTLKPPPEIWELVHPVEAKQFNPRQTFLRRLGSSLIGLSLMTIVVGLVLGVCIALLRFRGVQKVTAVETIQPVQVGSTSSGNDTANPPNSSASAIDRSATQPMDGNVSDNSKRATSPSRKRKVSVAVEAEHPDIESETTTDVRTHLAPPAARSQAPATGEQSTGATDSNKKSSSDSASATPKSNTSLTPQVIAPLKSDSVRKAKVIQWP